MPKTIVTSDQHLGYEKSNVKDFKKFLEYVFTKRDDVQSLILLGDLVDMWRRDVSGIFLEFSDIINQLLKMKETKKIEVYIVAGNHDYHILKLYDTSYQFKFYSQLPESLFSLEPISNVVIPTSLSQGHNKYIFKHGWEFDALQHPIIMEALCHNMSNERGAIESYVYDVFRRVKDRLNTELKDIINYYEQRGGYIENLLLPPEERLKPTLSNVERKAYSTIQDDQVLIFSHTHRPFISSDKRLINCGSWVKDAPIHNTFVEIDCDDTKIYRFKNEDETPEDMTASLIWNFNRVD